MGMTEGGVLRLFMLEGALMGVVGGAIGALLGGGLTAYWSRHPIDLSAALEKTAGDLSVSSLLYTQVEPSALGSAVALAAVVAVVASLYPARVASRLVPAEAVRAAT
jgi:ABC-type lipoprotein release transport system permease subunit